jgi:probable HAF family extracellular repeat protein
MKTHTPVFSAAIILLVLGSPVFAYQQIIDLGAGIAYSINDNGQIVGYATSSSGDEHACLFDSTGNGNNIYLGTLSGLPNSVAASINNSGQIVGSAGGSYGMSSLACLFDPTGGGANIDLKSLNSLYHQGGAYSINNSGIIVGATLDRNNGTCAVIFDNTGGGANKDLAHHISYQYYTSYANSINDAGKIVGSAVVYSGPAYYQHACLFDETGGGANIDLGTLGGAESWAHSINNSLQIVGYSYISPPGPRGLGNKHACLFDSSGFGANIDLGTLGGDDSGADAINELGQIAGWAEVPGHIYPHACIFDSTGHGGNIDLNTLVSAPYGWELSYANCINNNGWIVGTMLNQNGDCHAFLLTPEPASAILLAIGATLLRRKK